MTQPKTGDEHFLLGGEPISLRVLDYWRWADSDLLNNVARGVLAEFLVASALGVTDSPRVEWDAKDLVTASGVEVEVKSAAYVQSWPQKKPSRIAFDIAPKHGWDAATNTSADEATRAAAVYVFCLLGDQDQREVDPLDLDQWQFFVLSTRTLDRELGAQKSMALSTLLGLDPFVVSYGGLRQAIRASADRSK